MKKLYLLSLLILTCYPVFSQDWEQTNGPFGANIHDMASDGNFLYAATDAGLFYSENNGKFWKKNTSFPVDRLYSLLIIDSKLFVGTMDYGVFVSQDSGATWITRNDGLNDYYRFCGKCIMRMTVVDDTIFAATRDGLMKIGVDGTLWKSTGLGTDATSISSDKNIVIASIKGVYGGIGYISVSNDKGVNWQKITKEMESGGGEVFAGGNKLFACMDSGLFYSENSFSTSFNIPFPYGDKYSINRILYKDMRLMIACDSGFFYTDDLGIKWHRSKVGDGYPAHCMAYHMSTLYLGTHSMGGVFQFDKEGLVLRERNDGLIGTMITSIASSKSTLFAGGQFNIYRSENAGKEWKRTKITGGCIGFAFTLNKIFFANVDGVYSSIDNGISWKKDPTIDWSYWITGISQKDNTVYLTTWLGTFATYDEGTSWTKIHDATDEIEIVDSTVYTASNHIYTSENDTHWKQLTFPINPISFNLTCQGKNICVATYNQGIFFSSDKGINWKDISYNFDLSLSIYASYSGKNTFYIRTGNRLFYYKKEIGWENLNAPTQVAPSFLYELNDTLYMGSWKSGIWKTIVPRCMESASLNLFNKSCIINPPFDIFGGAPSGGTYSGKGVISGTFYPSLAGIGEHLITYTYTDTSGCSSSAEQTIKVENCTSISEKLTEKSEKIKVYPNPSLGIIIISDLEFRISDLKLYSVLGELIQIAYYQQISQSTNFTQSVAEGQQISLDLSSAPKGIYFLKISCQQEIFTKKILIQ